MADTVTPEVRSRMMAAVRSRNTVPEMAIRKSLHASGFRYRIHKKIGKSRPDILLPKYSAAIFVHGCFWHGHVGCRYSRMPKSNVEFWTSKIERNAARDTRNEDEITQLGWRIAVVWECAVRDLGALEVCEKLADWLRQGGATLEIESDVVAGEAPHGKTRSGRSA
ncbi:DNA mismatch endonuclease Vsr [Sinorhizobium meliloti]|nr:DNA mismatch endonuclease Vsr [Sinorhizobium meliloti]